MRLNSYHQTKCGQTSKGELLGVAAAGRAVASSSAGERRVQRSMAVGRGANASIIHLSEHPARHEEPIPEPSTEKGTIRGGWCPAHFAAKTPHDHRRDGGAASPRRFCREGDRHILLRRLRTTIATMVPGQSPTVLDADRRIYHLQGQPPNVTDQRAATIDFPLPIRSTSPLRCIG